MAIRKLRATFFSALFWSYFVKSIKQTLNARRGIAAERAATPTCAAIGFEFHFFHCLIERTGLTERPAPSTALVRWALSTASSDLSCLPLHISSVPAATHASPLTYPRHFALSVLPLPR